MSMNDTTETVVGIFPTKPQAQRAITELYNSDFSQIGFVARNPDADGMPTVVNTTADEALAAGAMTGAAAGALGGAAVGAGIVAGVIPVIGPILAIGTLGTVLLNAAGGAAVASIAGALVSWGIAEDDAQFYQDEVAAGKFLVTVEAHDRITTAQDILTRHGATVAWHDWKRQPAAV